MKRKDFASMAMRGLLLALLGAVALPGAAATTVDAALRAIAVSTPGSASQLQLRIDGDFAYKTVLATPDTLFIDLMGAKADRVAKSGEWTGGLLTGYRLVQFTDATKKSVVRVQVEMKHHQTYQAERTKSGLLVTFGDSPAATPAAAAAEATPAAPSPAEAADAPMTKPAAESVGTTADVSALFVSAGPEGEVYVDVDTSQPTPYRVMRLEGPRRLVIDLDKAHKSFRQGAFAARSPLVSGVRVAQFQAKSPSVVRVVLDLLGDPVFDVHAQPSGVRIQLKSRGAGSSKTSPRASASPAPKAGEPKPRSLEVAATHPVEHLDGVGKYPTVAAQTGPAMEKRVVTQPPVSVQADLKNALPAGAGSREVSAAPRPAASEPAPEAAAAAKAAQVLATSMPTRVEDASEAVPGTATGGQTAGAATPPEQPHYSGEPISLNLKDVDLKDFFRLIHEISGLNILIDPNVTGTVTLVIDNVPWDQALDIVLKNNNLGKALEGSVLRISKMETLTAEQEVVRKLAMAREDAQPLVTRFVPISYAKALDISTLLKAWPGGGALTRRGTALVDARTNTLIVSDIPAQIPVLMQIIEKLDTKTKQIQIEARIVLTTKTFERDIEGAINYLTINQSASTLTAGGAGAPGQSATSTLPGGGSSNTNKLTSASAAGFGAFVISNAGARYVINAMLAAAEDKLQAKTISQPNIVTQNNVVGMVTQGVQIPIQTSVNNTVTTTMVPAALTLTVTPQVTADGHVFMNIKVDNSSPGAVIPFVGPEINTQSATTQVLVPDGGTVIFGGITVNAESRSANYVPLLGDIPILGHFFKSSIRTTSNNELLFFVSPKVLPD
jgi:type IV pilus secretin PilQ/predicted competence protein